MFLQALSDHRSNKILLIVLDIRSEMGCRSFSFFPLLHLPFGNLSLSTFVPQIHYLRSKVHSRPFHIKVTSAEVIYSLHYVAPVFNLLTYNGLHLISSMHIPYRFLFAKYLDCMEGTPPMSSFENETGAELIIIIT